VKKILVDTNIWSTVLRRSSSIDDRLRNNLMQLIDEGRVAIIGPIRQEILSGIKDEKKYILLKDSLASFEDEIIESVDYEEAASISNKCIAKGYAVTAIDALIVAFSVRRGWEIYTKDKDFDRYEKISKLKKYIER
jgi:predicted nucleic acid-binding protein